MRNNQLAIIKQNPMSVVIKGKRLVVLTIISFSDRINEIRSRKGITETRVAFGGIDTPIKAADYQITFAAEALAYQKAQKFSSKENLKYSLQVLANKILKAKAEVKKAL